MALVSITCMHTEKTPLRSRGCGDVCIQNMHPSLYKLSKYQQVILSILDVPSFFPLAWYGEAYNGLNGDR